MSWCKMCTGVEPQYAGAVTPLLKDEAGGEGASVKPIVARWFSRQGRYVATRPKTVILCAIIVVAALAAGMSMMKINSSPESIWVPPGSKTSQQQDKFNEVFDPFFRIEQIIFTLKPEAVKHYGDTNMLEMDFLNATLAVQDAIVNGEYTDGDGHKHTLPQYCFEPIKGKGCMLETPLDYWRSDGSRISAQNYTTIQNALVCHSYINDGKSYVGCMSDIGVPVLQNATLGALECVPFPGEDGQEEDRHRCTGCDLKAGALMITWLLRDVEGLRDGAKIWEKEVFLKQVEAFNAKYPTFDPAVPASALAASYMAQRSVPDALVVVEKQNEWVVAISYAVMFVYIVLALGKFPHPVRSRIALGFQGIIIVACSVAVSIGVVSYCGMAITMIVSEVVPFLILAIGVDNMFIISKAMDRRTESHPKEPIEDRMAHALSDVGPTITSAAISECLAFAVGASTDIPALQGFCVVAALAVFVDYLLQITWFVAAVSMDARRVEASRMDIAPCVTLSPDVGTEGSLWRCIHRGKFVRSFMERVWAPVLMNPLVKVVVVLAWAGLLAASVISVGQMKLGLDQNLVLPQGSYLTKYFNQQSTLGEAGPPTYVVLQNINYSHPEALSAVNAVASGLTRQTEVISPPVYNWFQSFKVWETQQTYQAIEKCLHAQNPCDGCVLPLGKEYPLAERVYQFLYDIPLNSSCCQQYSYCGGQFAADVKFLWKEVNGTKVPAEVMHTRLRTQQTTLRTQRDFIETMQTTQHVVEELAKGLPTVDLALLDLPHHVDPPPVLPSDPTDNMHFNWVEPAPGGNAFAYSLYYVYYEQYNYIRGVALQNVLLALAAVFLAALVLSSPAVSCFVVVCVASVAIDLIGFLWCFNPPKDNNPALSGEYSVDINAVSVVNLVMAIGLAVEFCVHIATSFMDNHGSRNERATRAVVEMGSSVVTGITFTKFVGVLVLAWAPSILFRLYYFRMYVGIIVCGAFHGLIFLPVVLSLVGPSPSTPRPKRLSDASVGATPAGGAGDGCLYTVPPSRTRASSDHSIQSGSDAVVLGRAVDY